MTTGGYQVNCGLVRDVRSAGSKVPIYFNSFVGPDELLRLLQAEEKRTQKKLAYNLVYTSVVPSFDDKSLPAVVEYRTAMDKYKPQTPRGDWQTAYTPSANYSLDSLEGFITAKTFLMVLEKAGRNVTRKSFYTTVESMGQFDLGLGAPAEFSPTRHQALGKVWLFYATPSGWKPSESIASTVE